MEIDTCKDANVDSLAFARSYQVEALEKALKANTIVYLETGSGKTLIAIMLLRNNAYLLRKPSPFIAVFLVPQVVLVHQQAKAVETHTDLKVGMYWGDMGVDLWDASKWTQEIDKHEVLVMTPQILLNGLRHCFFKLDLIKVLIVDECHHARGKHPYACIMIEFYHRQLRSGNFNLPRIFGMTASPIKSKGAKTELQYWEEIHELENIMYSKVYTCASESVLAEFIPFSTPKFKFYKHGVVPCVMSTRLTKELESLKLKHKGSLEQLVLSASVAESTSKRIEKMYQTLIYCLDELGVWLTLKAAQFLHSRDGRDILWSNLDMFGKTTVKKFFSDASGTISSYITTGPKFSICDKMRADVQAGLITSKVVCLVDSLLEYRDLKDIRCIVFVERVVSAVVLQALLSELLPRHCSWNVKYIAGNNSGLQCQTRKRQNEIVEEFRKGMVNIIVATSILEEGLDVQSCNLVIRFDPSATISSFIQSRGRARMQNSDYILMLESEDQSTHSRLQKYLTSGERMRKESLRNSSVPCSTIDNELLDDEFYCVESTGAVVTVNSSVALIYFYCSRLPSDRYFKPAPRFAIVKEMEICTLHLPKACHIQPICVYGNIKTLKQKACLEACKQLHRAGALMDNLVPAIVVEEDMVQELGNEPCDDEHPIFFPPELVNQGSQDLKLQIKCHCYLIKFDRSFDYEIPLNDVVLVTRSAIENEIIGADFDLEVHRGAVTAKLKYIGELNFTEDVEWTVLLCRKFQITLFKVLMGHDITKLKELLKGLKVGNGVEVDYFLLPSCCLNGKPSIDWKQVASMFASHEDIWGDNGNCSHWMTSGPVMTKNGLACKCMLENSLVYTPHNNKVYCGIGFLRDFHNNSLLKQRKNGEEITYKSYYKEKYGIKLRFDQAPLLDARHVFSLQNCLHRRRQEKEKVAESNNAHVELPPELCYVVTSSVPISTVYSFSFLPSIMHRLEGLLIASNLKKMIFGDSMQCVAVSTIKVLEAITEKRCQEKFHLESLETLGDSFLKYAVSQQLFKTYQNHHEGLLTIKREQIISNAALCKIGCDFKLPGFIRNEPFNPEGWMIPGDDRRYSLEAELLSNGRTIYVRDKRKVQSKSIADVVEALIGAYLTTGGEMAALSFMDSIGIKVDFVNIPYEKYLLTQPEKFVNIQYIESVVKYSFKDPRLLVEALTHGSYMIPEIPRCYQRLEFLGDSVLDYLITRHFYSKHPGMSPGLLTDMRSASVNNDCYALSAVKFGLHKHILHLSQELQRQIISMVENFDLSALKSTFGWELESDFPKVLGDVIESLAGSILVDSGYDIAVVFQCLLPILEPLVTPETVRLQPVRELHELCQKHHFNRKKPVVSRSNGSASITIEVEADGKTFKHTSTASDKVTAKKLASREVLRALKQHLKEHAPIQVLDSLIK